MTGDSRRLDPRVMAIWPPPAVSTEGVTSVHAAWVNMISALTAGNAAGAGTEASPVGSSRTGMSGRQHADHRHVVGRDRARGETAAEHAGALPGQLPPARRRAAGPRRRQVRDPQRRPLAG